MREIALHLLDLLENAIGAGATRVEVDLVEDAESDELRLSVWDNGRGVPEMSGEGVFDPFFTTRTTRRVGLGLPLLKAAAERAGGTASLCSTPGDTRVEARFGLSHLDRAPLGDLTGTIVAFLLADRAPELRYFHRVGAGAFEFDTDEVSTSLGTELSPADIGGWVREYLSESLARLREGATP